MLDADERSALFEAEQQHNAAMLRWVSIVATFVIVLVVAAVAFTVSRNRKEITHARDEVRAINLTLEERVETRTHELALARERAEVLLSEVNHRVANSLQLVSAFVHMQARSVSNEDAKAALADTQRRIAAIAQVHRRLYTADSVNRVDMADYLRALLAELEEAWSTDEAPRTLTLDAEPLTLGTDKAVAVGVIVNELVSNACKYAYPPTAPGEVRVALKAQDDKFLLRIEDDGRGMPVDGVVKGTGLGSKLVGAMATTLKASLDYETTDRGVRVTLVAAA